MSAFYPGKFIYQLLCVCTLILITNIASAQKIFSPASTNNLTGGATYCQGATAGILIYTYNTCFTGSGSSTGTPITIKWYQNATNSTTGGTVVSTTLVNTALAATGNTSYQPATTAAGTSYYYCVITWSGAGTCNASGSLTSGTVAVIVNPTPDAISGTNTACVGTTLSLSNGVAGGTWSSSNITAATVSSTGTVYGVNTGSAIISYSIGTCRAFKTISVVNTPPAITGTNTICEGTTTSFSNSTAGGTWSVANAAVATIDAASPVNIAGLSAGTTTITYAITPTCYATRPLTVNVTPGAITGPASACQGTTVSLSNATGGGTWSSTTTARATIDATTGVLSAVSAGTSAISYTIGSCKSGITFTVSAMPAAIGGTAAVCSGSLVTLTNAVSGGAWTSSNTAVATANAATGAVTGVSAGNATITYAIGSCTATKVVTVNTQPVAISGSSSACTGTQVSLSDATAGGTWSSVSTARATITSAGVVSAVSAGTTVISYTLGSCAATRTFTVLTTPAAITGTQTVCQGQTRTYVNTVVGGTWSSSSSAVASVNSSTGIITGVTPGTATITYSTGCGTAATRTITVIAQPAAITGSTALCTGTSVTLGNTVAGGVWSSTVPATASVNSATGVVAPLAAGVAAISYTIGGVCSVTANVTVNSQPAAISGASLICAPGTISLSNTVAGGVWSSSNTAIATTDASGITSGVAAGNATVTYAIANCVATKAVTVSVSPTAQVSSAVAPCANYTTNVQFTGTTGATITYNVDGGASITQTLTGGSYLLNTGAISAMHTYRLIEVHDANCATSIDTIASISPVQMYWIGGATGHEADWNYAANWSCGFVPDSISDVVIPSCVAHTPSIATGTITKIKSLNIDYATTISADANTQLKVIGGLNNNGKFSGNGLMCLSGSASQRITGIGEVSNLKLQNDSGAVINVGSRLSVTGTLTLARGCLTTNDSLVLASGTEGTGRIAELSVTDTIKGQVKIQQYVQGGYRRYRFWSHPFSSALSLSQLQKCIDITGQGGAANGFTTTTTNAASAFRFDPYTSDASQSYDPGWKPFTKISATAADTNKLQRYQGIRLFVRGGKGQGLGYVNYYTPAPVVLSMSGNINHGDVDVPLSRGADANQEYNMVGNPYPSPVDIGTILYNAKQAGVINGSAFYIWNPVVGAGGQYLAIPIGTTSAVPYSIPANTAFQVKAAYDGAELHFSESNKTCSADNNLFKTPVQSLVLHVYDSGYHLWDVLNIQFNDKATNDNDKNLDAGKRLNGDFAFYSIADNNEKMAIDARSYSKEMKVQLGLNSVYAQDFVIRVENVPATEEHLYLHDKLMQKYVLMEAGAEYKFAVTKERETQGDSRFELTTSVPVTANNLEVAIAPNPASEDVAITYNVPGAEEVLVRVTDVAGVCVYSNSSRVNSGQMKVSLSELPAGIYMVEVVAGTQRSATKLVKE
jgi:uncharacterized protein YjdB